MATDHSTLTSIELSDNSLDGRSSYDLIIPDSHNRAHWISKCKLSCPVVVAAFDKTKSISLMTNTSL